LVFDAEHIVDFKEKPHGEEGWINGGFYVLQKEAVDYITGDDTIWEKGPIERLTKEHQLMGYRHERFWSCMDTIKEKAFLEDLWQSGKAPWKIW
jgi:glucose-1-phosphate cytidylyltransferase